MLINITLQPHSIQILVFRSLSNEAIQGSSSIKDNYVLFQAYQSNKPWLEWNEPDFLPLAKQKAFHDSFD